MYPHKNYPSTLILPAGTRSYRVQLARPKRTSIRLNGFHLAPSSLAAGRFDLLDEPVAYLASNQRTALFESVFRRQVELRTTDELRAQELVTVVTESDLMLVDLRGLEQGYPFLVHGRFDVTQSLAPAWRAQGFQGIVYASAQHPGGNCLALFEAGIRASRIVRRERLMVAGQLLSIVIKAAASAVVPIV